MENIFKAMNMRKKFRIAYDKFMQLGSFNSPPTAGQKKLFHKSDRRVNEIIELEGGNKIMATGQGFEGNAHGFIC